MSKNFYRVRIPIVSYYETEVEAESDSEAISMAEEKLDKGLDEVDEYGIDIPFDFRISENAECENLTEDSYDESIADMKARYL